MRSSIVIVATALCCLFFTSACRTTNVTRRDAAISLDLDSVVKAVKEQYAQAALQLANEGIPVQIVSADLSLKVTQTKTGSGDVKVLIFKPSEKVSEKKQTTVTFHFSQTPAPTAGAPFTRTMNLKDIIVAAAKQYNSINTSIGSLTKDNFEIDVAFSLEYDTSAGVSFTIWGIGADFSAEYDKAEEHDLKLVFKIKP